MVFRMSLKIGKSSSLFEYKFRLRRFALFNHLCRIISVCIHIVVSLVLVFGGYKVLELIIGKYCYWGSFLSNLFFELLEN